MLMHALEDFHWAQINWMEVKSCIQCTFSQNKQWTNVLPSIPTSELATYMLKTTGNSNPNLVANGTLNKLAAVFFFLLQEPCL